MVPDAESAHTLYICTRCRRIYKHKCSLQKHLRLECQQEPKYECTLCPYKGKRKSSLESHMICRHSDFCPNINI